MIQKKTLVFHDTFITRSGAEKMNISIANILEADIATAIWSTHCYNPSDMGYHGKIQEIFQKVNRGWVSFFLMKWRFFWSKKITKGYERVVVSNEAITAIHRVKKGTETIYYAHKLPHELFDGRKEYMRNVPFFFHEFYAIALFIRKYLYLYELRKVGKIFTNSEMNRKWLMEWSKRDDIRILYPPVNTLRYHPAKKKTTFVVQEHNNVESVIEKEIDNYYISLSRLESEKRVDRIIHAFIHMPDKYLIVFYNSQDTEKQNLMHMARGYNNIFFHEAKSSMELTNIIGSSVASLALCHNEDF
jgi:glycosyltransferase involved in cell wall biosynthesis